MNEAIEELKENEFKDLYPTDENLETKTYVKPEGFSYISYFEP
jgi:transcription-repair coupling factor (superfamily II helicase)